MRGALGNSLLLSVILFCLGVIIVFFVGILSYSKAYKVKNRIIDIIEKHEAYDNSAQDEIIESLGSMGYKLGKCVKNTTKMNLNTSDYKYCIYKKFAENGEYYRVVTYIEFYFPVINELLDNIPVYGETKILKKDYSYE